MTDEEALEYWEKIRKTFMERYESEDSYWGRHHWMTSVQAVDSAISALRDRIARQNPQPLTGWISVGDRLPETSGEYQCYCNGKSRIAKFKADKSGMCYWDIISNECYSALWRVTHWMPMPEPPERAEK